MVALWLVTAFVVIGFLPSPVAAFTLAPLTDDLRQRMLGVTELLTCFVFGTRVSNGFGPSLLFP